MNIVKNDFLPFNDWKEDINGMKWAYTGKPKFIVDCSTNRKYLNENPAVVGFKSFLLTIGTPLIHTVAAVCTIAYRLLKLATLSHFWIAKQGEKTYDLNNRLKEAGLDLLKIVTAPLAILGLELAALYGIFRSYDGRKLYATIERAQYGSFVLAPCFQPDAQFHAFGGDINQQNAF